jgi:PAT family beta-lactamase induction signal transducer AmpG
MSNLTHPYRWIPSVYMMQGLPFALITAVSAVLYKLLHISNATNALYTSLFALPWLFKPLFAPVIENMLNKRSLTLIMQFLLSGACLLLAVSLSSKLFFMISSGIFFVSACFATLHDTCSDGLYILHLAKKQQAQFIGTRCLFYQLGKIIAQGGVVFTAGYLTKWYSQITAWHIMFVVLASFMCSISLYHYFVIPPTDRSQSSNILSTFKQVYHEFIMQPNVISIISFTILYELPQAQLMKIIPLFLLDNKMEGGLAVSPTWVGILYGSIGIVAMIIGITLSGLLISLKSLKSYLVPFTIIAGLTTVGYALLSYYHFTSLWIIGSIIVIAQFGFGLSNGAYMVYILQIFGKGSYPTSTFAIGTTLMSLGTVVAGAMSGYLQYILGYSEFFLWIIFASLGMTFFTKRIKLP